MTLDKKTIMVEQLVTGVLQDTLNKHLLCCNNSINWDLFQKAGFQNSELELKFRLTALNFQSLAISEVSVLKRVQSTSVESDLGLRSCREI